MNRAFLTGSHIVQDVFHRKTQEAQPAEEAGIEAQSSWQAQGCKQVQCTKLSCTLGIHKGTIFAFQRTIIQSTKCLILHDKECLSWCTSMNHHFLILLSPEQAFGDILGNSALPFPVKAAGEVWSICTLMGGTYSYNNVKGQYTNSQMVDIWFPCMFNVK